MGTGGLEPLPKGRDLQSRCRIRTAFSTQFVPLDGIEPPSVACKTTALPLDDRGKFKCMQDSNLPFPAFHAEHAIRYTNTLTSVLRAATLNLLVVVIYYLTIAVVIILNATFCTLSRTRTCNILILSQMCIPFPP